MLQQISYLQCPKFLKNDKKISHKNISIIFPLTFESFFKGELFMFKIYLLVKRDGMRSREGGRILRWGGEFRGRANQNPLFSGEFRPQSNSLGKGEAGRGNLLLAPDFWAGRGKNIRGGPWPPSTALPDERILTDIFFSTFYPLSNVTQLKSLKIHKLATSH